MFGPLLQLAHRDIDTITRTQGLYLEMRITKANRKSKWGSTTVVMIRACAPVFVVCRCRGGKHLKFDMTGLYYHTVPIFV